MNQKKHLTVNADQYSISEWEADHSEYIKGWMIEYLPTGDEITFMMIDGAKVKFVRV